MEIESSVGPPVELERPQAISQTNDTVPSGSRLNGWRAPRCLAHRGEPLPGALVREISRRL